MQIGDTARLVQPEIRGELIDTRFNKEAGELEHLLKYPDVHGEPQERWFLESALEVVS